MERYKRLGTFKHLLDVLVFAVLLSNHVAYAPYTTSISPNYGSLAGETRLTIYGSGFSADQFSQNDDPNVGNKVYLVGESGNRIQCPVHNDGCTEIQIMCYTPDKMPEQSYDAKVVVDGVPVPDASLCLNSPSSYCKYSPRFGNTPTVTSFEPHSGRPGGFVTMKGKFFTDRYGSNTATATNGRVEQILRVYVGPREGELKTGDELHGLSLDSEDSNTGVMRCKTQGTSVGFFNASFIASSPLGRAQVDSDLYRLSYKNDIYMYQVYTDITSISPNKGSTAGGLTLRINGNYFDNRAPYTAPKAYVGDTECVVTNVVVDEYIECTVAADPLITATKHAGNRGVNFEYWTFTTKSNLDDILALTSSSSGHVSSALDETYYADVNDAMDNYVSKMETYFLVPHTGKYEWQLIGDDKAKLFVDSEASITSTGGWAISGTVTLTKGQRKHLVVVHQENSGDSYVWLRAKFFGTKFTSYYLSKVKQERQTLKITSTVKYEEQELTFSSFTERSYIKEVQTVNVSTNGKVRFGVYGVFTEPIDINNANGQTVSTALNTLPIFNSEETVTAERQTSEAGVVLDLTFNSKRGDYPNMQVVKVSNEDIVNYTVVQKVRGSPDMDTVALEFGGKVSDPFSISSLTDESLGEVIGGLFGAKCPAELSANAKVYLNYETSAGQFSGSITNEEEPFCGRYSLINPDSIFKSEAKSSGQSVSLYKWVCFAYKGLLTNKIWMKYTYNEATTRKEATDSFTHTFSHSSSTSWYYTCFNMYTNIMNVRGSDSNHRVKEIWLAKASAQDIFVDALSIGQYETTTDFSGVRNLRRRRPFLINGAIEGATIKSATVSSNDGKFKVVMKPHECGHQFPLFKLANGKVTSGGASSSSTTATLKLQNGDNTGSLVVVRKRVASPPVTGVVNIEFNGNNKQRLNVSLDAAAFQRELETLNGIGSLTVEKTGDCANFDLAVTFQTLPGDLPLMTVDADGLSGINAAGRIVPGVDGGIFYDPLTGDMVSTVHSKPQVRLMINDVPVACTGDCSFQWEAASTPTVTAVAPGSGTSALGTTITITGTGFSSTPSQNSVAIGGVSCSVTAATSNSITCDVGNGPVGGHKVVVTVTDKGDAAHSSGDVIFEYTASISSVSPTTGGLGGGITLTINGYGFKAGASVTINSKSCTSVSIQADKITCTVPAQTTIGTFAVSVSSGNSPLTYNSFKYDSALTSRITNVSPSVLGVAGGRLSITGSDFGTSRRSVYIGTESATIVSWSDSSVVVDIGVGNPGVADVKVDTVHGYALLSSNTFPNVNVDLSITNVYPLRGSVQGGTILTITGTGFGTQVDITVGNVPCDISAITTTKINCMIANAGKVHQVTNRGTHRAYGIFYAFDRPYLRVNRGDFVNWSWETLDFVNDIAYAIIEVDSPSTLKPTPRGFKSPGTPSANGQFQYQFTKTGTYYAWSGYVDKYWIKSYVGTIEVIEAASSLAQIDVKVSGRSAIHNVGGASNPSDSPSCKAVTTAKTGCSDALPSGGDTNKFNFAFWTCSTPIVNSVSEKNGTVKTAITINGEGLSDSDCQNEVTFGTSSCTVTSSSSSSVTCNLDKVGTPTLGVVYPLTVRVGNRGYALMNIMITEDRSFGLLPNIEVITPMSGSLAGGTVLTITGFGFGASPFVSVGGYTSNIVSNTFSEIKCETPGLNTQATKDVLVKIMINGVLVTAACELEQSRPCTYIYSQAKTSTVTAISPSSLTGQTTFTISGTSLGTVKSELGVTIGGESATVTEASNTEIKVTLTNLPAGSNSVIVKVKDYGKASGSLTVTGTASISSVSPTSGSTYGQQLITIQGNGFVGGQTAVTLDGADCDIKSISLAKVVCSTPPRSAGSVSLAVTSKSVPYNLEDFEYATSSTPTVYSVNPTSGLAGSTLTITGSNLAGGLVTVQLDDVPCTVTSRSSSEIQCILGNHATGSVPVFVHVASLGASNTDIKFEYQLSLSSINPTQGGIAGGQKVTLTGTGFTSSATVTFCNKACPLHSTTSTEYVCKTPSVSAQTCDVEISVNSLTKILSSAYTYDGGLTPTVAGVSPRRGGTGGGTTITVSGSGFGTSSADAKVTIGNADCVVVGTVSDSQIICQTGSHQGSIQTKVEVEIGGNGIAQESISGAANFQYIDVWSSTFTWGGGPLPAAGEFIVIPAGQTILLDTNTPVLKFLLIQGGSVIFDEKDIELQAEIIMITGGGLLQVGTEAAPFQHKGIITLHGHHRSKELPIYGTKVVAVRNGTADLHGIEVPITWTRLAATAASGANSLTLVDPVEWNVGDEIVIAATGHHRTQSENEKKTIRAISGDKKTLTIDSALEAEHVGTEETFDGTLVELRGEVGLLTHNVVVRGNTDPQWEEEIEACEAGFKTGEFAVQTCFLGRFGDEIGSSQFGAMILVHSPVKDTHVAQARISYTEITFAGQAFRLGRYPIHFHLNGDMSTSYVRGCGIHHTFNRAVNIHGTHNTMVENNVIYNIMGGAFFLEDGIETGNTFQYNLAVFVRESSSLLNDDITPASFWVTNPNNTVQHNAAAGGSHFGYWYRMHENPEGPSFTPDVCCKKTPLGIFNNNSAHSFGWFGLWIFPDYFPVEGACGGTVPKPAVFQHLYAWNNEKGAEAVNSGALQFDDFVLVQNKKAGYEGKVVLNAPKYTDDGPMVKNSLIVGKTTVIPNSVQGCTDGGIVFPYGFGFQVKNVRFVNFADSGCATFRFTRIDGTCKDQCGGYHYQTEQISCINAPNKAIYAWDWEGILIDKDGSITGKPSGWQVIPTSGTIPSACEHIAEFSKGVPASVCPPQVKFHRFSFNKPIPTSLEGKNLILTNQYGTSSVPFMKKRITHKFGWMCNLVDGETYDFTFDNAEQIQNISYQGVYYDFGPSDWVLVETSVKKLPDRFSFTGGSKFISRTPGDDLDPDTAANGDFVWINSENKLKYIVSGAKRSKRTTTNYGDDLGTHFTAYTCFYDDCIPPADRNTIPPKAERPADFDFWTDTSLWNDTADGWITADPNTQSSYGVPMIWDSVKIPYGMWVVINATTINKLRTLRLEGVLEIIDTAGYNYELNADFIIIMGGRLIAGWPDDPFDKTTLSIILRGNHSSPIFSEGDGPNVGSKAIGVFGGLDLFGKEIGVTWTQLSTTALAGANRIVLKDAVTWSTGDDIVLGPTSYNVWQTETFRITGVANDRKTLTLNETLKYKHIAHSETINGKDLDLGAAVGLLTRNIKIIGEEYSNLYKESFGARVLVASLENDGTDYFGYARLSNVEFYHTGQEGFTEEYDPRFSVAYVATGTANDIRPSYIRNCTFRNGFNSAIGAYGVGGLNITDNVVYHTVGNSIRTSSDDTRIINNMVALMVWTGAYQDRNEPFNFRWEAGIEAMTAKNVILQGNLVTGSERIGIHAHPLECGDTSGRINNNKVQSNFIGYVVLPPDKLEGSCALISGYTAWKNHDYGIYYQGSLTVKIYNNLLIDNRQGIFALVPGPSATGHAYGSKTIEISNSLLVGATSSFDCDTDISPSDDNVDLGSNGRPRMAPTGGMIGIVFPSFMSNSNNAPMKPFAGILTYNAIRGLMTLSDVTFAHYGSRACKGDFAIGTSGGNDDGQHPVESQGITFVDVDVKNKITYHRPNIGKINGADCVDMDCDGLKKALFKDMDGTFLGSVGAVLPQSEFEWDGDPRRGLGDYRIPKEMVTRSDGTRIPYSTMMPHKGVLRSKNCQYIESWQAYQCFDYNWEMLILESMDDDTETRRISPVAILSQGYVDLINGPQDHGWCSGYTCRKRLSTFMAIVATDHDFLVHFTGTTPEHMRYHLLNVEANQGIKLTVWYSRPNRLDVYVDGSYIKPTNSKTTPKGYETLEMPVADEFDPMVSDATGTNFFDRNSGLHTVIIKGQAIVEVKTKDVIIVSFGLPALSISDFYGDNIIEYIAAFFDIPLTKVRIVNAVSAANSGRRKRSSTGINVDVEIGDGPANDTSSTVPDSMDRITLLSLASSVLNECQVGNVSQVLNTSASCNSLTVPGESVTDKTMEYSSPVPNQLVLSHAPIPIYETYLLQQQPKVQATDISNVVVTELGINEYPWQLTVSIRPGTGHPDAILDGSLTVNASNGWFNFTDLSISHMGTGYILDFNVIFPTVAENFTLATQSFDVAGRPIKAKILPVSLGGDLTPSSQFAVTLDLRDSNTDQIISNISWRSHTWSASASILGNPRYGSLGGITSTTFDPDTGQAIFPDLQFNQFGIYYIQFWVVSSPTAYDFTINHKMVTTNDKFAGTTQEKQNEISMKFDVNYDTVLPDEDKQNEFEQFIMEDLINLFTDIDFRASSLWRGSIVTTFVIRGSTIDVNDTTYTMCDIVHNGTSYNFYGHSVSLSKYMTIDNETFYGISCHVEEPYDDDDDDDGLHPGVIAATAIVAFIILAATIGVIVWAVCVKPKTKTHSITDNSKLYGQDKRTGEWYIKEASFIGASAPAPPVSVLYNSPYASGNRRMSSITVHMHSPETSRTEGGFDQSTSDVEPAATYCEPSGSRTPSPTYFRGSSSPKILHSSIPQHRGLLLKPPIDEQLYNSEYIRTHLPKMTSPYMPDSRPWRKHIGKKNNL